MSKKLDFKELVNYEIFLDREFEAHKVSYKDDFEHPNYQSFYKDYLSTKTKLLTMQKEYKTPKNLYRKQIKIS